MFYFYLLQLNGATHLNCQICTVTNGGDYEIFYSKAGIETSYVMACMCVNEYLFNAKRSNLLPI